MAMAIFGPRGITVVRDLLKASGQGLDLIQGGGGMNADEFTLVWANDGFGLKTTNSMATSNALIFQYPAGAASTIRNLILSDSITRAKALTLVLQTGTITSDTIKFMREIRISLEEQA